MYHKSAWILWKFQKKVFVNRSNAQSLFEPANNKEVAEGNWWIDFNPTITNGWWSDSGKDAWASLGKTCLGLSPHSSVSTVSINVLIDGEHPLHLGSSNKN